MKHFHTPEKAKQEFVIEYFGKLTAQLDVDGLAPHIIGERETESRGLAYYSKILEGEITPPQLAQLLLENSNA